MGIIIGGNNITGNDYNSLGENITPNVVTDGLILWLDAGNTNSYGNADTYYDCGYGCQYYSSNPGCTNCNTQWKDMSGLGMDWTKTGTFNGDHFTYNSQTTTKASISAGYTSELTMDTWFYPPSGGINVGCCATIFGRYYFRFFMIGQSIFLMIGFADSNGVYNTYQHPSFTISYNAWHHIVGMRRGNSYIMWIDGVEVYNTTFGSGLILHDPSGTWSMSDASHTNVKMGGVKVYNRGLTNNEILQNFNSERSRFGI